MPEIERSKVRAMLMEASEDQREPLLLRLKERGYTVVEDGAKQPEGEGFTSNDPGEVNRAAVGVLFNAPVPGLAAAKGAMRRGGEALEQAGGATSEALGRAGVPDVLSAAAGSVAAIPGALYGVASGFVPGTVGEVAMQEAGGAAGKFAGKGLAAALPPIEARAPNAVRAVRAAMSANILPTIPQATQSQAWATAEEVTARIPWFGRRIKAMRQAQESAYQALRTAAVKEAGPSVPPSELGETTRGAVYETLEATTAKREKELAKLHAKALKSGGDPVGLEEAARQFDEIRVANVEAARKTAGKHYDELAEMIPPDADKVAHSNARGVVDKWAIEYKNLPQAKKEAFSPLARGLMDDIKAGPGANVIENAPRPHHAHGAAKPAGPVLYDAYGDAVDIAKVLRERKSYTFGEMQTLRSTINSGLHQARLKGADMEVAMLSDLKKGLDLDIAEFGKSLQGDISEKFKVATAYYKDVYKGIYRNETVDTLGKVAKENPQAVFDMLVGRGNVVDIKIVKKAVGESGFAPMRRLAVERMVTSPEGRILSGPEITKRIAEYSDEALKEILTPKQIAEVTKFRATRELPKFVEGEMEKKLRGVIFEREGVFRAPEDVVNRIINGDTATFKAVKRIVGKKGTDQYRRRIIEDIIGEANDPSLLPGQAQNQTALKINKALRQYDENFLKEAFSPKELAEIEKIDDIKALMESQQKLVAAPGTTPAASALLAPAAGGALMVMDPIKGTAALIAAEVVSRFYVSDIGRRLMIEGFNPKNAKSMELYGRIIGATANATRENSREDRLNRGVQIK